MERWEAQISGERRYATRVAIAGSWRAIAGLAIGGSLALAACGRNTGAVQAPTELPSVHSASALVVTHPLPVLDLEAAGLTRVAGLVTPFEISSTDNGRTMTLIAAYADTARMVLLFRESPDMGVPNARVNDEQGLINASGSAGPVRSPVRGDYYFALDGGAHPGADGLAHLAISIADLTPWTPAGGSVSGNWAFNATLKVQPGEALAALNQFRLGTWKVTVETLELTPAVVHLQTVVDGASPEALMGPGKSTFVELVDAAGKPVTVLGYGAGITVPKEQVNPMNYQNSRMVGEWLRPAAGTYRLRFEGGGGRFEVAIIIGS
jgi:hypothetical protein